MANRSRWISLGVIVASLLVISRSLPWEAEVERFEHWIDGLGLAGPIVFGLIYVVATVLMVPGTLLSLLAGAMFGLPKGFALISISSTAGATCAFLVARYLAREKVATFAASRPRFAAIDQAVDEGGWRIVALLRLSPAIPFNLQNYLYGLMPIRLGPYVLSSWLAMMPGTFMYIYLGHLAGTAVDGNQEKSPWQWAMLIVGLLATVLVSVYITRLAGAKLRQQTTITAQSDTPPTDQASSESSSRAAPATIALAIAAVLLMSLAIYLAMPTS